MDIRIEKPRSRKRLVYAAVPVALLACLAVWSYGSHGRTISRTDLELAAVRSGDVNFTVAAFGTLAPSNQELLTAYARSTVRRVVARPGSEVGPGRPIVELSSPELEERHQQAQAELEAATIALREAELAAELARVEESGKTRAAQRQLMLDEAEQAALRPVAEQGVVSKLEMKRVDLKVASSQGELRDQSQRERILRSAGQAKVAAQREAVRSAQSRYRESEARLRALLVAPQFAARVQEVFVTPGQSVAAGDRIAQVATGRDLVARLQVPQARSASVREGASATLELDGKTYAAIVKRVDPRVQSGMVHVEVSPTQELPTWVKENQPVNAEIEAAGSGASLYLPKAAFLLPYSQQDVFVQQGRRLVRRTVRLGGESGGYVEVLAGLRPGDQVATSLKPAASEEDQIAIKD